MATENPVLDKTFVAGEDLTADQFRFVVLYDDAGTLKVRRPNSATEVAFGILQNSPEEGEAAVVRAIGISKLEASSALGANAFVMAEYVSASDAGKGADASGNLDRARGIVVDAAGADADLCSVLLIGPVPSLTGSVGTFAVAEVDAAEAVTYDAADVVGGLILRDPAGGARSDLLPTAAALIAEIPGAAVGRGIEFTIRNTADAAETITVTTNTGLTLSGTMTIAQGNSKRFLAVITNVDTPAVSIYSLGTAVH